MGWPANNSNYSAAGVTTIRWGTSGAWVPNASAVVISADQAAEVEKIYLEQGDGLKSTRILLNQGKNWDFTIQDDTGVFSSPPSVGDNVVVVNFLGNGTNYTYKGIIIDNNYRAARKQEGQRVLRVESLTLVDTASA